MRKRLWQLHAWLGLFAGLGLLVIGLTGSLLMFRHELDALATPDLVVVEPAATGRLPFDRLLAEAERQLPDHVVAGWLPRHDEPGYADVLYVLPRGGETWQIATLDPFTGRLLATPRDGTSTVSGWLLELHYAFFADHAGMVASGLLGVALCVLGVTGIWIHRSFWNNLFLLRWKRGARLLFSDLHRCVGILSAGFNLVLGFTGAWWNLTHVGGHLFEDEPAPARPSARVLAPAVSLDALLRDADVRLPGFRANYVSLPLAPGDSVTLWGAVEPRGLLRGPYGSHLAYEALHGDFQSLHDARSAGWGAQLVDSFVPLHYGNFGGLPVKVLWSLGGLAPGILAITGFLIWRYRRRQTRPASARADPPRLRRHERVEEPV